MSPAIFEITCWFLFFLAWVVWAAHLGSFALLALSLPPAAVFVKSVYKYEHAEEGG